MGTGTAGHLDVPPAWQIPRSCPISLSSPSRRPFKRTPWTHRLRTARTSRRQSLERSYRQPSSPRAPSPPARSIPWLPPSRAPPRAPPSAPRIGPPAPSCGSTAAASTASPAGRPAPAAARPAPRAASSSPPTWPTRRFATSTARPKTGEGSARTLGAARLRRTSPRPRLQCPSRTAAQPASPGAAARRRT